ncbi:MAG TPA: EbsC protein [Chloroflexi bacterium]|nr:EbsC protein [Chloroflexota bacterium]
MAPRTPADLQHYITAHGITAEVVFPAQETPTVPAAAAAMGCEPDQIIKSVLFLVEDGTSSGRRPVLVIACGTARIDYKALAAHFGVSRKKVRLAPPHVVLETLGYPAGGVPPFGHITPVPVLMDEAVTRQAVVYGGGGDDRSLMRLTVDELRRVTRAAAVAVSEENGLPL